MSEAAYIIKFERGSIAARLPKQDMIGIQHIKAFVPGQRIPATNLPEYAALSAAEQEYFGVMGIESYFDAGTASAFDLARRAADELLAESGVEAAELDAIIYIRPRIPERFIASEATRLQHELAADKAIAFGLADLGCADSTMALKLARDMLTANRRARYVLIAYGHKQYAPRRFRMPVTIQGDGGVAALVGRTERNAIVDLEIESNGRYWDLFSMSYRDRPFDEYEELCSDMRKYGFELAMESKNRFEEVNQRLLERNEHSYGDMQHILLQNISQRAYEYYEMAFEIAISPVCKHNLARYGHLGCADILINYATGLEAGLFQQGDFVLVMNNSPVAAWSSLLLQT